MICQCPKQLTDAISVARSPAEPRCAVRSRSAQRRTRVGQSGELGILPQTRQDADAGIRRDKLERIWAYGIGDQPRLRPSAMLVHIILQLTQCTEKSFDQPSRKASTDGSILGMLGPLIPVNPIRCFGV